MTVYFDGATDSDVVDGKLLTTTSGCRVNLCPNGSFEHWCGGYTSSVNETPTFWIIQGSPRVVERDVGEWDGYEGCYSVKVSASSTASGAGIKAFIHNLKPSTEYQISTRVQVSSGFQARIALHSAYSYTRMLSPTGVTGVWYDLTGKFVTTDSGGSSGVLIFLQCCAISHCVWWDRVMVCEGTTKIVSDSYTPHQKLDPIVCMHAGGGFATTGFINNRVEVPIRCVIGDVAAYSDMVNVSSMVIQVYKNSTTSSMLDSSVIITTSSMINGDTYGGRGTVKPSMKQCEAGDVLLVSISKCYGSSLNPIVVLYPL